MEELLKQIKEIEAEMAEYEDGYAKECAELYKKKGFDLYKPRWRSRVEKIATKYAQLISPLRNEYSELREEYNRREAERINNQFKD